MMTLLKLEWLKVRKYRAFMLLLVFFAVSVFGINYMVFSAQSRLASGADGMVSGTGGDVVDMVVGKIFHFPEVWQTVSYLSSFLLFIPGLILILVMTGEYSFRTARQSVINGVSRGAFIDTKIAVIFITALVVTVLVGLTTLGFGSVAASPFTFEGIEYLGYFFVQAVSYMSMALVFALLLKRSGVAIGLYFLYVFIVENLLSLLMNKYIASGAGPSEAGFFLPLESSDKLIPMPSMLGNAFGGVDTDPVWLLVVACAWIAVCLGFCRYRFMKSDL